jgi:diguanylate cyclase
MEQSESLEQAKEFARSAMSLMIAKKITANPNNFTVWFHYFSNKYPDLRRTLEILLSNDQEFTTSRNAEIFEKFFTFEEDKAAVSEAASNIEMELVEILKYLGLAGDGAAEYGKVLEAFSAEITEQRGEGELKTLVTSILSSTRDMEARNKKLEVKLNASAKRDGRDRVVSQDEVQDKELAFGF